MEYAIELKELTKRFNQFTANDKISFQVEKGEIHALAGENGAGKTTLMNMIYGLYTPTSGELWINGEQVKFTSSRDSIARGIGMVHQHFMLVPKLTVAENIIAGQETGTALKLDRKTAEKQIAELSDQYGLKIDPSVKVGDLSVTMQQRVEILKVLYRRAEILIFDEPTAVLTPQETEELFEQLNKLKESGLTIIFISHKLNEIKEICQRITIMRHGKGVGTYDVTGLTVEDISKLMVGRDIILKVEKGPAKPKETRLSVRNLSCKNEVGRQVLNRVSFSVRSGEILGIAGVEGSGQEELVELITGMRHLDRRNGEVLIGAERTAGCSVKEIRRKGMSYIPEDRMVYGAAGHVTIRENMISSICDSDQVNSGLFLNKKKIDRWVEAGIRDYDIRCGSPLDEIGMLSGGNMQKVIVAREFSTEPSILIADQPTRGVDVGAIEFIHKKIVEIRDRGCAVLLVSADLNEILELSDSIIVMCQGRISGYFPQAKEMSEEELGYYMLGVKNQPEDDLRRACCEE